MPADPPTAGNEYAVHPLRGAVCLSIVVMHLYYVSDLQHAVPADWRDDVDFLLAHARPGYESFFLLSGFFLAHALRPPAGAYLSVPRLLARRLLRLVVPYWVAVLGTVALLARSRALGRPARVPTAEELLAQLACVQDLAGTESVQYVFWSMAAVIQFYVLGIAVYWLARAVYLRAGAADYAMRTERVLVGLSLALGAASAAYRATTPPADLPPHAPGWAMPTNMVFFAAGGVVYWATHGTVSRLWLAAVCGGLAGCGLLADRPRMLAAGAVAAVLAWLAAHPGRPRTWAAKLLAAVGRRSYSVYLTHAVVGGRVVRLYDDLPTAARTPEAAAGVLAAAVLASVGFGWVFHRLVEEPVRWLSRRVDYRR